MSYVSIDSGKHQVGYGTKLFLKNGTFERLIQGRIMDEQNLDGFGKEFYNAERTVYYIGDWVNGKKWGKGTKVSRTYTYIGDFKNDTMTGFGKITWPKIGYYVGTFLDNKFDGKGKYVGNDGNEYEGLYSKHKRNGDGIEKRANGDVYEGTWRKNRKVKGKERKANGDVYDGTWYHKRIGNVEHDKYLTGILTRTAYNNCIVKYKSGQMEEDPRYYYCLQN